MKKSDETAEQKPERVSRRADGGKLELPPKIDGEEKKPETRRVDRQG